MRTATDAIAWSATHPFRRFCQSEHLVLWLSLGYFIVLAPFTPGFATTGNLANLLATLLPLFVAAVSQTLVLIPGGIDLSVTSVIALTSVAGSMVMSADNGWLAGHPLAVPAGITTMLLLGALVGLLNGTAVTRFGMPPFIVTLTSMTFFSGLAIWLTRSKNISGLPGSFTALGSKTWVAFLIAASLAGAAQWMLSQSIFGRWLYAVGHNAKTSLVSGVPVNGVKIASYICSGLCAAAASVLYTGQAETGSPVLGQRILLDILGATVLGGTSLFGGKGKILWTLFGVLFLKLIDNSLNLLNLSLFTITMAKGGVILFAALMDALRHQWLGGSK